MPRNKEHFIFSSFPSGQYMGKQCKFNNGEECMYLQGKTCQKYEALRGSIDKASDKESLESREKGVSCGGIIEFMIQHQEALLKGNKVETVSPLGNIHVGRLKKISLEDGEVKIDAGNADFYLPEFDTRVRVDKEEIIISSRDNSAYTGETRIFFKS